MTDEQIQRAGPELETPLDIGCPRLELRNLGIMELLDWSVMAFCFALLMRQAEVTLLHLFMIFNH